MTRLPEGTRCGIHGDPTESGRCATCDQEAGRPYARAGDEDAITKGTRIVYLSVAVPVDEEGHLAGAPAIDWDGSPWPDYGQNVWDEEGDKWESDMGWTGLAEAALMPVLSIHDEDICRESH